MRIFHHPILGKLGEKRKITFEVNGKKMTAYEGEPIAAALLAAGIRVLRMSPKRKEPRGVFCAIGRCTDCVMIVDGQPNVRTCVTPARDGMKIQTQKGLGKWAKKLRI